MELTNRQCNYYNVYIAYNIRPQTPANFKDNFDSRIKWIRVENFQQSIGLNDLNTFFEIKNIVANIKPNIIHLHSSKAGVLGRCLPLKRGCKVFYTPNGFSFLMQNCSPLRRHFYWIIESLLSLHTATIIACGKGEYKAAVRLSHTALYVNNGISIRNLKPFIKDTYRINPTPVACITGRITDQKNPYLFNDIAKLLLNVKFIWIGEGELQHELTSSNIEITGWQNKESVLQYVADSDFFILPSLWEGLPFSLIEAMYLRKICLVSDAPGNRDLIEDKRNGFICRSAEDYKQIIISVLHRQYDWKTMVQEAHNDVVNIYNADLMAEAYRKIYERQ
jgi:glycosyltransferase involved in cell wall biosynthesis